MRKGEKKKAIVVPSQDSILIEWLTSILTLIDVLTLISVDQSTLHADLWWRPTTFLHGILVFLSVQAKTTHKSTHDISTSLNLLNLIVRNFFFFLSSFLVFLLQKKNYALWVIKQIFCWGEFLLFSVIYNCIFLKVICFDNLVKNNWINL